MIGKDELKGWMITRTSKPLTLLLYRRQNGSEREVELSPATALPEGGRHSSDWEWHGSDNNSGRQ